MNEKMNEKTVTVSEVIEWAKSFGKPFLQRDLIDLLGLTEQQARALVRKGKEMGLLRMVRIRDVWRYALAKAEKRPKRIVPQVTHTKNKLLVHAEGVAEETKMRCEALAEVLEGELRKFMRGKGFLSEYVLGRATRQTRFQAMLQSGGLVEEVRKDGVRFYCLREEYVPPIRSVRSEYQIMLDSIHGEIVRLGYTNKNKAYPADTLRARLKIGVKLTNKMISDMLQEGLLALVAPTKSNASLPKYYANTQ